MAMAPRRFKKMAVLHKIETVEGTDATPAAADAIIGKNVTFTPMEGQEISRDLILPYLGNQGIILAGLYGRLEMDVEIAGAGAAGSVPKFGSLLRVCGMAETIAGGSSVTYSIVDDGQETGSLYFVMDKTRHVLLGGRANVALNFAALGIPTFRFTYTGLLGQISDIGAMPPVVKTGWIDPLPVTKANSTMTLHGWTSVAESLSIDLGNTVTPRFLIGDERMLITDRQSTGTAVVEARPIAEIDWFTLAKSRTRDLLTFQHGKVDGNIVEVNAPAIEIGRPTIGQSNNIANYSLPLALCTATGLDEFEIVIR